MNYAPHSQVLQKTNDILIHWGRERGRMIQQMHKMLKNGESG